MDSKHFYVKVGQQTPTIFHTINTVQEACYGLHRALACTGVHCVSIGFTAIRLQTFRSAALSGQRAAPAEAQAGLRAARRS